MATDDASRCGTSPREPGLIQTKAPRGAGNRALGREGPQPPTRDLLVVGELVQDRGAEFADDQVATG